jgi:hypothetical protein
VALAMIAQFPPGNCMSLAVTLKGVRAAMHRPSLVRADHRSMEGNNGLGSQALKNGQAVFAEGTHEAVVSSVGRIPESGRSAFDLYEQTKGAGSITGATLWARETIQTLTERGVPVERGCNDARASRGESS